MLEPDESSANAHTISDVIFQAMATIRSYYQTTDQAAGETTAEAENSDFNLTAASAGCSSATASGSPDCNPTATALGTAASPTHSSAGGPARGAATTLEQLL